MLQGNNFVEMTVGSFEDAPFATRVQIGRLRKLLAQIAAELFPEFIHVPFAGGASIKINV